MRIRDLGWKKFRSGINIPDPQHSPLLLVSWGLFLKSIANRFYAQKSKSSVGNQGPGGTGSLARDPESPVAPQNSKNLKCLEDQDVLSEQEKASPES
jgi:hypothetical protein